MNKNLTIVLPSYRSSNLVLRHVKKLSHKYKIIIIENSFDKNLANIVKQNYKNVDIYLRKNIGFGRGHNQNLLCINFRPEDIYLITNPDITFNPYELFRYVEKFSISEYVCIAPLIKNPSGKVQYSVKKNPTVLSLLLGRFKILRKIRIFKNYYEDHINYNYDYLKNKIESSYLSGCFLLVKAVTYHKVKGFDSSYFLHLEDADFTRTCSVEGKVIHNPECTVFHEWARGSHKSVKQMFFLLNSMFIYFKKWGFKIF